MNLGLVSDKFRTFKAQRHKNPAQNTMERRGRRGRWSSWRSRRTISIRPEPYLLVSEDRIHIDTCKDYPDRNFVQPPPPLVFGSYLSMTTSVFAFIFLACLCFFLFEFAEPKVSSRSDLVSGWAIYRYAHIGLKFHHSRHLYTSVATPFFVYILRTRFICL